MINSNQQALLELGGAFEQDISQLSTTPDRRKFFDQSSTSITAQEHSQQSLRVNSEYAVARWGGMAEPCWVVYAAVGASEARVVCLPTV